MSRFFSWAIERGNAGINPFARSLVGKRPKQSPRQDQPWLDDHNVVRKLISDPAMTTRLIEEATPRPSVSTTLPWIERDPSKRQVDVADTPRDLYNSLRGVAVTVAVCARPL